MSTSTTTIDFQLIFEDKNVILSSHQAPDLLFVKYNYNKHIKSLLTRKSPKSRNIRLILHRLIEDEVVANVIQSATNTGGGGSMWGILGLVMTGFWKQSLWGALTTQQLILMISNLDINVTPEL